jgi:hypothetical protein
MLKNQNQLCQHTLEQYPEKDIVLIVDWKAIQLKLKNLFILCLLLTSIVFLIVQSKNKLDSFKNLSTALNKAELGLAECSDFFESLSRLNSLDYAIETKQWTLCDFDLFYFILITILLINKAQITRPNKSHPDEYG